MIKHKKNQVKILIGKTLFFSKILKFIQIETKKKKYQG